jgi:hypothetical protein
MSAPFTRTETAPVLCVFGPHAARVADLVRLRPALLNRLAFAPVPAIHAIGAWLHLAPEADRPDPDVAVIIDQSDPRDLLRAAIPQAPAQLYRALARAGGRVLERSFYERLAAICVTPVVDVLWGDHPIDGSLLRFAEKLLRLDPLVLKLRSILRRSEIEAEQLQVVITFLRTHNALKDEDLDLPPAAGKPALAKRLQAALDRIEAPDPGFELNHPYRIIRKAGELRAIGKELGNCLASFDSYGNDFALQMLRGSTVIIACEDPRFVASIAQVGPRLWTFAQMSGRINQQLNQGTIDRFQEDIRNAGVALLPQSLSWSLATTLNPRQFGPLRRRRNANVADDLDLDLGDDLAM